MILEKTRALLRKDRAAAQFLSCLKKIQRIDEKMKTANGEKLQRLADQKEILEYQMDLYWIGMGHQIEYRDGEQ
jgi:hypothetical protein